MSRPSSHILDPGNQRQQGSRQTVYAESGRSPHHDSALCKQPRDHVLIPLTPHHKLACAEVRSVYKLLTLSTLAGCSVMYWPVPSGINIVAGKMRKQISPVTRVGAEQRPRFVSPGQDQTRRQQPDTDQILINTGRGHTCHVSRVTRAHAARQLTVTRSHRSPQAPHYTS